MSAQGCYHSVFNNSEKLGTIQVSNNRQLRCIHLLHLAETASTLPNIHSHSFLAELQFYLGGNMLNKKTTFPSLPCRKMCSQ